MNKLSIQLFKDNNDLCVVFKNIDSTMEESLVEVFSSFLNGETIKDVPELLPLPKEEIVEPVLNKENEISAVEKPLFLQEANVLSQSSMPIKTIHDFIDALSDKSRFDELSEYYKINKNLIEKFNIETKEIKKMLDTIYTIYPNIIQKHMSEKSFVDYGSFVESCKIMNIRKMIRASLSAYFKEFN